MLHSLNPDNPLLDTSSLRIDKKHLYLKHHLQFLIKFSLVALALLTISRLVLMYLHWDRVAGFVSFRQIMAGGLRIDLSLIAQIIVLPCLALLLLSLSKFKGQLLSWFIRYWCWFFLVFMVFLESTTPTFIDEYDTRPNRLFFEYLSSPVEVIGMLFKGYLVEVLLGGVVVVLFSWFSYKWVKSQSTAASSFNPLGSLAMFVVILILVVCIRSGFQHRPINPAMVAFSQDRMINTLPLNSTYSLLFAIYQMKNEASSSEYYGHFEEAKMLALIKQSMPKNSKFISENIPTLHTLKPSYPFTGKNLIIVVEESLGAQFVGSLGGKPLTPNIDKWKQKSWFFNHLYATGTRSARGLEAITTGFLPSPARAVLKLPKAQGGFYTLAQTLNQAGYESGFIYGGESHFDNMKGFFLANGFTKVVDQNDYINPEFTGNWGVSDEDLFNYAMAYLKQPSEQPKFSLIFSSSNHTPFEFPDSKIKLYDAEKQTVNNAVKYADFALGQFLDELENSGLMDESIVLVVADHDARVMGDSLVPIERFHVPGFIISKEVGVKLDENIVSHIDLGPTLLSLLGLELATPMIGQDLTQLAPNYIGRAIMQYGDNQAFMQGNQAVIMVPEKDAQSFAVMDGKINSKINSTLVDIALAHAQFASWAYDNSKYATQ